MSRTYRNSVFFKEGGYTLKCVRWYSEELCEWNWAYTLKCEDGSSMHVSFGGSDEPTIETLRRLTKLKGITDKMVKNK